MIRHYHNDTDLTWSESFVKRRDLCWELWQFIKCDLVSEAEPVVCIRDSCCQCGWHIYCKLLYHSVWTSKHDQISYNIITFYDQILLVTHYESCMKYSKEKIDVIRKCNTMYLVLYLICDYLFAQKQILILFNIIGLLLRC